MISQSAMDDHTRKDITSILQLGITTLIFQLLDIEGG